MRAEESSGTQEGGDLYHIISGRMRNSCWVYKVNWYGRPFPCKTQINDYDEIFVRGSGKGVKVVRRGPSFCDRKMLRDFHRVAWRAGAPWLRCWHYLERCANSC